MNEFAGIIRDATRGMSAMRVMEVCGTHTQVIAKYALRELLPDNIRLVSGPGCPVCVTHQSDIAAAMSIAENRGTALFSFGDMLRVPGPDGRSLWTLRENGADVRLAVSPADVLLAAQREPQTQFVYFAVGFETTAPLTAVMLKKARAAGVANLSVLSSHKTMPNALRALLRGNARVDALLCPGHVSTVTGADAFRFVAGELGLCAAVSGFLPDEVMAALAAICVMRGRPGFVNMYPSAVSARGNTQAQRITDEVFVPCDAVWRGLGKIAGSGLDLRAPFAGFDARTRFELPDRDGFEEKGACECASILRGENEPRDCPLFARACTPERPAGPCMVSAEGSCAVAYRYGG